MIAHKSSDKKPGTRGVDKRVEMISGLGNMVGYERRDHSSQEKVSQKLNSSYQSLCVHVNTM